MNECVYCGDPPTTVDHIPPKSFFKSGYSNLITVPSCEDCNGGRSKTDEYVRTIFAMSEGVEGDHRVDVITKSSLRGLLRPEAAGFAKEIFGNAFVDGEKVGYFVDNERIMNWMSKIATALYYRKFHKRYQGSWRTVFANGLVENPDFKEVLSVLVSHTKFNRPEFSGDGEFKYWHVGNDGRLVTVILFYDQYCFVCLDEQSEDEPKL